MLLEAQMAEQVDLRLGEILTSGNLNLNPSPSILLQRQAASQLSCSPAELCPLVFLQLLPAKGQKSRLGFVSRCLMAASVPLQGVDPE